MYHDCHNTTVITKAAAYLLSQSMSENDNLQKSKMPVG